MFQVRLMNELNVRFLGQLNRGALCGESCGGSPLRRLLNVAETSATAPQASRKRLASSLSLTEIKCQRAEIVAR
jgi:hypothetical protein